MFDLLRVARAARTVLGLVGFYRYRWFRTVAVWLACAGVAFAFFGPGYGPVVAVVLAGAVFAVRRAFSYAGTHRA